MDNAAGDNGKETEGSEGKMKEKVQTLYVRTPTRYRKRTKDIKIIRKLYDFYKIYAESRFHSRTLLLFMALTALEVVVLVYVYYIAAKSLGVGVSFSYFISVIPLVLILIRLPISIDGIGILEGLVAYFLILKGFSAANGVAIVLSLRVAGLVSNLLPGCIFMWITPIRLYPPELKQ